MKSSAKGAILSIFVHCHTKNGQTTSSNETEIGPQLEEAVEVETRGVVFWPSFNPTSLPELRLVPDTRVDRGARGVTGRGEVKIASDQNPPKYINNWPTRRIRVGGVGKEEKRKEDQMNVLRRKKLNSKKHSRFKCFKGTLISSLKYLLHNTSYTSV